MTKQTQNNPWLAMRSRTAVEYDAPYEARAKAGMDIHGEANFIMSLLPPQPHQAAPWQLLDAGCGTGRVSIELARRGLAGVGEDLEAAMLGQARRKAPELDWRLGDLATLSLAKLFDCIVMPGNVMIFLTPGSETAVIHNLTHHLKENGLLVAAFELTPKPWTDMSLEKYDQLCHDADLHLVERWSTWERNAWKIGDRYAVSVHRKRGGS
jgi:SAM-dependent methyltransferase